MNRNEFEDRVNFCRRELEFYKTVKTGCPSCSNYIKKTCKIYGPVPKEHIDTGCDQWDFDDIPF